jgi:hypothetical protein
MNPDHTKNRRFLFFLLISAVLFLGLVQWSFLPLLIDSGLPSQQVVLSVSSGHTSKFAAPFKGLFADSVSPCLLRYGFTVPVITVSFFHRFEEQPASWDDRFFSHRQYRAPPSV